MKTHWYNSHFTGKPSLPAHYINSFCLYRMVQKTVVSAQSDSAADLSPASENVFVLASFPNVTTDNEKITLLIIIIIDVTWSQCHR